MIWDNTVCVFVCACVCGSGWCSGVYDGIRWIRSHFYFLAEHWWRLSRASCVGMLPGGCQVAKHNSSPMFTVPTDSLHHKQYCIIQIRIRKGRGAQREKKEEVRQGI